MRRVITSFAAFTMIVSMPALLSSAFAHGGSYRGPAGGIPDGAREPSDPPPPPEGDGPSTPGSDDPGGPTTGGPDTGGPTTPGGPGTGSGGPSGPSGGPTGGGAPTGGPGTGNGRGPGSKKASGYGSWVFWWGNNKDEILQVRSAVIRMRRAPATGNSFGRKDASAIRGVTDEAVANDIVPALRKLLADETQVFHIRSAAELGLAKIGDTGSVETLRRMATNEKNAVHREIEETAALALGLMQQDDAETRELLTGIVRRQARDGTYARPFSAISLGLLGDRNDRERAVMSAMFEVIARKEPGADIKPACLTALGLLGNDAAVPELAAIVRNGKASAPESVALNEIETAYAVAALGKIGKPGTAKAGEETRAIDEVLRVFEKEGAKFGTNARRSAAIALGQIGPQCAPKAQRKVVDVLQHLVDGGSTEEQERNFAVISLGRIGAAKGVDPVLRRELVTHLSRTMEKGRSQTPAFAAMALGLVGRAMSDEGYAAPEEEIRAPLRARFDAGGDPQMRGAFALASGLVRDPLASEHLLKALNDSGTDRRVRGWCALSLGMIGDGSATESIRAALKDSDRDLRVQSAMAAGLLQDATVIGDVVGVLRDRESSNYELGSAALALGQIGDERAIAALLEISMDATNRYPDLTRALAVVALGQIGDRRDVPTLARFATDVNYRAHVPAITELLTIL